MWLMMWLQRGLGMQRRYTHTRTLTGYLQTFAWKSLTCSRTVSTYMYELPSRIDTHIWYFLNSPLKKLSNNLFFPHDSIMS